MLERRELQYGKVYTVFRGEGTFLKKELQMLNLPSLLFACLVLIVDFGV